MTGKDEKQGAATNRANQGFSGAEFAGIGVQFAAIIVLFAFAGLWLDRRLGSSPWLLIVCVFAGAAGGIYSMYRKVIAVQRRDGLRRSGRES